MPDPLSALDEKYRGAVDEIPELFREYLRLHSEPVHDWFRATSEEARVRKPPTLAQVLSRAVPRTEIARQKFMHALTELIFARPAGRRLIIAAFDPTGDARQVADARGRIPERVQMIVVLNGLWTELCGSGAITQFLAGLAEGDDLHAAERWCRRIGARRMASYLRAAARLFPEAMDRSPDPFAELDDKYESAVNEIPVALHAYLKRYQGVLERWLEVAGPSSDRGVRAESGKQARR